MEYLGLKSWEKPLVGSRGKLDFIDLFEKYHNEMKIEFDRDLALYFGELHMKTGGIITHMESFDENLPPMTGNKNEVQFY